MRFGFGKLAAAIAVICAASSAHAVTLELTGVTGPSMGGVYTSPYTALIGAPGESVSQLATDGVAAKIICDDFTTDVSVGQSWQDTATNLGSLVGETSANQALKFGNSGTVAAQQSAYMSIAYLAEQLVSVDQSTAAGAAEAGQLSFAIWSVYDPAALNSISGVNLSDAEAYLSSAQTAITQTGHNSMADYSNVTVYTSTPKSASQEYIVVDPASVPEPGVGALLATALAGLGALVLRRRGQQTFA